MIGHPNAILLGFLAGIANLIPYFGGIGCNIVAAITAFVVSPGLFVRTIIAFFLLSSVDSYVINPAVYGKTNSIHPLITIFAMFAGGAIFGIVGIFIAFPIAIIIVATYKFYKEDISDGIEKIKENSKQEKEA
jgi:predicted PurR-regulated permease PerM